MKHFIDLRKQIKTRMDNLNLINKQAADALHRWYPYDVQTHPIVDSLQVPLEFFFILHIYIYIFALSEYNTHPPTSWEVSVTVQQ